jgi:type I restriction enzyme M protein
MGALGGFFGFVNGELLPYLKGLRDKPNATSRQKVISEILSGVERVRVDTEKNFLVAQSLIHSYPLETSGASDVLQVVIRGSLVAHGCFVFLRAGLLQFGVFLCSLEFSL